MYCHGHIHDDPVEVVTTPADSKGGVIIISAPRFSDGFKPEDGITNNRDKVAEKIAIAKVIDEHTRCRVLERSSSVSIGEDGRVDNN